jgi:aerobic carbon-monoxide dehydrogenase medium subunit
MRDNGSLRIGAATTHATIEDGHLPDVTLGLMPFVASGIAYRAVRNLGTIGGSLALADPSADWPLCLLALGAQVEISGKNAIRTVDMDDFLVSAFTTAIESHELLVAIDVPPLEEGTRWGYVKLARKHGAFADSVCASIFSPEAGPRIALGATSDRAMLLHKTMQALTSTPTLIEEDLRRIVAEDVHVVDPEADSFRQRCHVATVLRSIRQARERLCSFVSP